MRLLRVAAIAVLMLLPVSADAAIVFTLVQEGTDTLLDGLTIVEGTNTLAFDLRLVGTAADAGAALDGFTYAYQAVAGPGTNPSFVNPTGTGLNTLVAPNPNGPWGIVGLGAIPANFAAANVNAPGGSGLQLTVPENVIRFELDTSGLVAGDSVTISEGAPIFSATLGGLAPPSDTLELPAATFTVSAVPEPGSLSLLAFASVACCVGRRRR